jgi:hypothetical protein
MNPEDPESAQHIVTEYAKPVIKAAIRTSVQMLASTGQLTPDLRAFLETAYVSLADYLAPDLVRLIAEYRHAAEDVAVAGPLPKDKMTANGWRTVADSGRLVGEIARSATNEAQQLKAEFSEFVQ